MILAEVSATGVSKGNKKWNRKNVVAETMQIRSQQILVAYGAGDASKRASRGCSSLHSAHT